MRGSSSVHAIETPWAKVSKRWGHKWHSMCSYLGTFPPALANCLIRLLTEPGDVVLDPFSGRGTTLLEARLLGRMPLASDLNPIAVALSKAKNACITHDEVLNRINELEKMYDGFLYLPEADAQQEQIKLIFHTSTLAQLCFLKRKLLSTDSDVDNFLIGCVLGIMHGKERKDGSSGYASISMPNTFSMSPDYVRRFIQTNHLQKVPRNIFQLLRDKIKGNLTQETLKGLDSKGIVSTYDARVINTNKSLREYAGKVKLILTSPPYLDVVKYTDQNWIRTWFLDAKDTEKRTALDDGLAIADWLNFAEQCVISFKELLSPEGVIVMVVGDVSKSSTNSISLAREFIIRVKHRNLFKYVGCVSDHLDEEVKTTRIWKDTKGRATSVDRLIFLSDRVPEFNSLPQDLFSFNIESEESSNYQIFDPLELQQYATEFTS